MSIAELIFRRPARFVAFLVFVLLFAKVTSAQTTLNFVQGAGEGNVVSITNPSSNYADVRFAFYRPDGSLPAPSIPFNPVSYRIPPKGRFAMTAAEIFGGTAPGGWIQATSPISGLGGPSTDAFSDQVLPLMNQLIAQRPGIPVVLTNSGNQTTSVSVKFYNDQGREIPSNANNLLLTAHSQTAIAVPAASASVHVTSSLPVAATTSIVLGGTTIVAHGQSAAPLPEASVVPFFKNGVISTGLLQITNPASDPVTLLLTHVSEARSAVKIPLPEIPGNGSVWVDVSRFVVFGGYLRMESDHKPLTGVLFLNSGAAVVAIPLISSPSGHILFNTTSNTATVSLVSSSADPVTVDLAYINAGGATVSQKSIPVAGSRTIAIRDVVPPTDKVDGGFIAIRSKATDIYAVEMIGGNQPAIVAPQSVAPAFAPNPVVSVPGWAGVIQRNGSDVIHPGDLLVGSAQNVGADLAVACGGKSVESLDTSPDPVTPGLISLRFIMPQIEPGFVSCKIRSGGMESAGNRILVMDAAGTLTDRLSGQAFYQKVELTDIGLDLERTSLKPIRSGRIEVFDASTQKVISVSEADENGKFVVAVPPNATNLLIQAVSRLRSVDLMVEDNTNANQLYVISSTEVDMRERPASVPVVDRTRKSGAFNILEQIERSNDFVHAAYPQFQPFPFAIFWSEKNENKSLRVKDGTHFNLLTGTAYILGDRNTDSDEYDDSVLIHEYAHMLAAKFSHDDSIGGAHNLGDQLDPRVAWSEGWANFFSGAVRNDAIYRDSTGPGGAKVLHFNLDENYPANSLIGYGSETSVQVLLWDFFDDKSEFGDGAQFTFSQIWAAFTDLTSNHYVYLPYFLDHLLARNPDASDSIQRMAQAQNIYFQPGVIPSVTNPFPSVIAMNSERPGGVLDSLTPRRTNLSQSSHFFVFTATGGPVTIQLSVLPGPANNPNANDLDLYLTDIKGKLITKSFEGRSGQGEIISSIPLPPGSYVVEVRSYYLTNKGSIVFNSGRYSLSLSSK